MPIYYGRSADGSDAQEFEGMHVSPCGKYWGNMPFKQVKSNVWKNRLKSLTNKKIK